jgi:H/ACA ribonucleoprotein complex subunit 4
MITLQEEQTKVGRPPAEKSLAEILPYSLVPIDKPKGPTSHEVSSFVRKMLGLRKTGHYGTLDANVSGVLPILLEHATKASPYFAGAEKTYVTIMRTFSPVKKRELEVALKRFRGPIYQTPPLASAVRKQLRVREVHELELIELEGADALLRVRAAAGFYVRKLCTDLGEVLGCGATMHDLRRTRAGGFTEEQCVTLQELSDRLWLWKERGEEKPLREALHPLEEALPLKRVWVSDGALHPITTGADLAIPGVLRLDDGVKRGEHVQVLTGRGELACLAHALKDADEIRGSERGIAFDVERVIRQY